jgi:hypothetical protein
MSPEQITQILNAASGNLSTLISQVAWFFAIGWAAKWLSFSFPLLMLFSVFMKVKKNMSDDVHKGFTSIVGWILLAVSLYTGTRGVAHLLQAGLAPTVYVANESGFLPELLKNASPK